MSDSESGSNADEKQRSEHWDQRIHDAEDLYTQASMRWGGDAQMAKAAEEFAELSAVCARDVNDQADLETMLEELIDARIMIEQMAQHVTDRALDEASKEAINALENRLKRSGQRER